MRVPGMRRALPSMRATLLSLRPGTSLDMIAANQVGQDGCGFESCDNALSVYWTSGAAEIALGAKPEVARQLVSLIGQRMGKR